MKVAPSSAVLASKRLLNLHHQSFAPTPLSLGGVRVLEMTLPQVDDIPMLTAQVALYSFGLDQTLTFYTYAWLHGEGALGKGWL